MPQPIDLQTEAARVTLADRIQQISDRMSLLARQRATIDAESDRVNSESQVIETHETEDTEVDAEGRRKNPFVARRTKKKQGASETKAGSKPAKPKHYLDISG